MRKALITGFLALALSAALGAQEPPAPPAPVLVAQFLGFSESQATQLRGMLEELQGAIAGVEQQMRDRQQRLEQLLSAEPPDAGAIGAAMIEVRSLQRRAQSALESYHQRFLALLSPEQKEKVQAVIQASRLLPAVRAFAEIRLIDPPR